MAAQLLELLAQLLHLRLLLFAHGVLVFVDPHNITVARACEITLLYAREPITTIKRKGDQKNGGENVRQGSASQPLKFSEMYLFLWTFISYCMSFHEHEHDVSSSLDWDTGYIRSSARIPYLRR